MEHVRGVCRAQPEIQACEQKAQLVNRPAPQMQSNMSGTLSCGHLVTQGRAQQQLESPYSQMP